MSTSNPSGSEKYCNENLVSTFGEEEAESKYNMTPLQKGKRSKGQKALKNSTAKSEKNEFIGWGSKPLIEFLESIGKDTKEKISQWGVDTIINKYINDNSLSNAKNKKEIICDERLNALFGIKTFRRKKIYDLLELHYLENVEFLEKFRESYSSEEDDENKITLLANKKMKKSEEKEMVIEAPQSRFASIIAENIELIYLQKSLVMKLLKESQAFESMLIGSFVRVKSDPNDFMQKNYNQLVQVTGVKEASPGGGKENILLQVSNRFNDFTISMLSDGNFSEVECEDLRERVKNGQIQKLTVVEIEEKARILHIFKTEHRIAREKKMLQDKIDDANEKGRRIEFYQFMERRELLETEAEKKRLLEEVPKIIAEVLETEINPDDTNKKFKQGNEIPPKLFLTSKSDNHGDQWEDAKSSSGDKAVTKDNSFSGNTGPFSASYGYGSIKEDGAPRNYQDSDEEESYCNDQNQRDYVEHKIIKTQKASPIFLRSDDDSRSCINISSQKRKSEDLNTPIFIVWGQTEKEKCFIYPSLLKPWGNILAVP